MRICVLSALLACTALLLAGCGGGSGGGGGPPPAPGPLSLYVSDTSSPHLVSIWRPVGGVDGDVMPDSSIGGLVNSLLDAPWGIHHDSRTDTLLVGAVNWVAIKFFDNVSGLDGDVTPTRVLTGGNTLINSANAYEVFVDEVRDLLYVAYTNGILVFENAGTIDGNVAPARHVTGAATQLMTGNRDKRLFVDVAGDRLYLAEGALASILVFDNASTADGNVAPSRAIAGASTGFSFPWGIGVDVARNILYVSDESESAIFVFDNASSVTGDVAPSRTIRGPASLVSRPAGLDVDSATNRLYVTNIAAGVPGVSIWENASVADGAVPPTRHIGGPGTGLNSIADAVVAR